MNILGISAYYHDSAAALISSGKILAAAQEERFTRKKHDSAFPGHAIQYCLDEAGMTLGSVDRIVFYDKPLVKFERLLETYLAYAPEGFQSFRSAMPVWLKEKLFLKPMLRKALAKLSGIDLEKLPPLHFTAHHESHAASAYYPSPFDRAAVLCMDGVGEWATTSVWLGDKEQLLPQWQIDFPHSIGLLYSAFTYFTGFKVNSGEYKLMGLAPYGKPIYVDKILDNLVDVKPDGTFRLDMKYFSYATGLTMTNKHFSELFERPPREAEGELTQHDMDLAASVQVVTEDIVLKLGQTLHRELETDQLCLAGGVALNCVSNGKLLRNGPFKDIWIQPAAGDAGGALGAALSEWHLHEKQPRVVTPGKDTMRGSYLGPRFGDEQILDFIDPNTMPYTKLSEEELPQKIAELIDDGKVIGWFQGRMEFGPRALGGRSIIGDPRNTEMQSVMNLKIKYRESFRPFAPSVAQETVGDYFEHNTTSPYMLMVANVKEELRIAPREQDAGLFGIDLLNIPRSSLPAITHVDYSARIQTVSAETNPRYHALLHAFKERTGCSVLINTSFNVRGEPIVCTPEDAYRCFMRTEMDYLVIENYVFEKQQQPTLQQDSDWRSEFELD